MGVSWLTLRQQKLLFRGLDANRDGRIDTKELQSLSQKRSQIELWRMEKEEKKAKLQELLFQSDPATPWDLAHVCACFSDSFSLHVL